MELLCTDKEPGSSPKAPLPSQEQRVSIANLIDTEILDVISQNTFCQILTVDSLKTLMFNLLAKQRNIHGSATPHNSGLLQSLSAHANNVLDALTRKGIDTGSELPGAAIGHEKCLESIRQAQEQDQEWHSRSELDKAKSVYLILSKRLLDYLPENISINKKSDNEARKYGRRKAKIRGITLLSKIIVSHVMHLSHQTSVQLANQPNCLAAKGGQQASTRKRQEKINKLKDVQEREFVSIACDELSKKTSVKNARRYLQMASFYENLPAEEKNQPSLMRLISSEAPSLLLTPEKGRKFPPTWDSLLEKMTFNLLIKYIFKIILANDNLLKKAVELSKAEESTD
jgi:hypothetical protein